ncbi:MAG: hypothetical protein HUK15_04450 [Bacteroidales bacterium]|nr:hypothetical protein [Bacteroidales bacterium]
MVKKILFLSLFSLTMTVFAFSQNRDWRMFRHELVFGAGTAQFLGDLGGGKGVGTHFVRDFDIQASRWSFNFGYGCKVSERFALRTSVYYGRVFGSDNYTPEYFRNGRGLAFRSPIIELNEVVEFSILRETYGNRYSGHGKTKKNTPNLYIYAGVGGFYFNPRGQYLPEKLDASGNPLCDANGNVIPDTDDENYGKWYSLRELGTEGQGYFSTRPKYRRVEMSFPVGFGMNYLITRNWGIGFDFGVRYTMTDYLDDVSTTYVSPDIFTDDVARWFSNRSSYVKDDGTIVREGPGGQRGESKYNDAFMFLMIKATYKITPNRKSRPKF